MLTETDLKSRVGPILADGTQLRDLIDIERREVSLRVLNDPEIHELELRRIFARSWVVVGHVGEIPHPGDYVLRYIGEDQVIVVRDTDGEVSILLNTCSHRGMEVCRADQGNEMSFVCPYHNWTFDTKGHLVGAPQQQFMYGDWDKAAPGYGLLRARVGICSGIIFGNFDQNAESLDDYLGDYKYYLDFTLGETDPTDLVALGGSASRIGGPRFRLQANWKVMNDQFVGDHYHTLGVHRFSMDELEPGRENHLRQFSAALGTDKGHVLWKLADSYDEASEIRNGPFMRVVFPNVGIGQGEVGGRTGHFLRLTLFWPKGPTDCEMFGMSIMHKDNPMLPMMRDRGAGLGGGPVSNIFADDATQGPSVQRAVRGAVSRNFVTMKYPARNGASDLPDGLVGPAGSWDERSGYAYIGAQKDENQWNWWRHYFDVLTAED